MKKKLLTLSVLGLLSCAASSSADTPMPPIDFVDGANLTLPAQIGPAAPDNASIAFVIHGSITPPASKAAVATKWAHRLNVALDTVDKLLAGFVMLNGRRSL